MLGGLFSAIRRYTVQTYTHPNANPSFYRRCTQTFHASVINRCIENSKNQNCEVVVKHIIDMLLHHSLLSRSHCALVNN